jgi:hypothetical protein
LLRERDCRKVDLGCSFDQHQAILTELKNRTVFCFHPIDKDNVVSLFVGCAAHDFSDLGRVGKGFPSQVILRLSLVVVDSDPDNLFLGELRSEYFVRHITPGQSRIGTLLF